MEEGAMAKELLPDAFWARIAPLLPPEPPKPKGGRPRAAFTGIVFVLKTGIPWEYLPAEMGCETGLRAWRRVREGDGAGGWKRLHELILCRLRPRGRVPSPSSIHGSSSARAVFGGRKPAQI